MKINFCQKYIFLENYDFFFFFQTSVAIVLKLCGIRFEFVSSWQQDSDYAYISSSFMLTVRQQL